MKFEEYVEYDAVGLAGLVTRRDVTAFELLEVAAARLDEVNPKINAVIRSLPDEAEKAISDFLPKGSLFGVPFLLKDLSAHMAGVPTSAASRVFVNTPAVTDTALVSQYRAAGLVIFGKTNTPEFGLTATTEPVLFGPTRNPWDLLRTPGGSSGGSAAAVAAGVVPAAHASDGGGSIRIPASCCGLFGLKPSRGRVSKAPAGEGWGPLSTEHVVTRSVRDSATLLDIAFQPQPGDPYRIELPTDSFADLAQREVGRLRIGFTTAALASRSIDHECVAAVEQAAAVCEELGYDVEECVLPGDYEQLALAANAIASTHLAVMLDEEARRRGSPIREVELETLTSLMYNAGRRNSASDYVEAVQFVHSFCRTIGSVFRTYDVIMTSTLGSPPVQLGVINANASDLSNYREVVLSFMPNTQLFNASGLPAASIPLAWSRAGVPIGIQFAANYGEEALLLQLATQLERACPWWSRRPAL